MPRVSVVIPVHNRAALLPETLNSVLQQTYEDWECIVVDDHSTDNSLEVAESYAHLDSRFRVVSLPEPKRYVNAARNYGLSLAKGEFVNFLDSDDILAKDKLIVQTKYLDVHVGVSMVTCIGHSFKTTPGDYRRQPQIAAQNRWLDALLFQSGCGILWPSHGPLWRKSAILQIGAWNEAIHTFTDPELNFRAITAQLCIKRLNKVLVYWRIPSSNTNLSHQIPQHYEAIRYIWSGYEKKGLVTPLRKRVFRRRLFHLAQHEANEKSFARGTRIWLEYTRNHKVPFVHISVGIVILGTGRISYRLGNKLRDLYFSIPVRTF